MWAGSVENADTNGDLRGHSMKIILDIPDSYLPTNLKKAVMEGTLTPTQERLMLKTLLQVALDEFEHCRIGVDEYKLVLTKGPVR
jgi:hypothetical protein